MTKLVEVVKAFGECLQKRDQLFMYCIMIFYLLMDMDT